MATKHDNLFTGFLIFAIIVALLWLLIGIPAQADVYILTGADSTTKVFDAFIKGGSHPSFTYRNYGGSGYATVGWTNAANDYYDYPLIDFDVSGCPVAAADVDSAILFGVAYEIRTSFLGEREDTLGFDTISVEVNQVLVQWGEGVGDGDAATEGECSYMDSTANTDWNSAGCNGANTDIDATPTGWCYLDIEVGDHYVDTLYIDVTDDVKDMLADPVHPNEYAGWKLTPVGFTPGEDHISSYAVFFTKESAEIHDPNKWKLLIYYTVAEGSQNRRRTIMQGTKQ